MGNINVGFHATIEEVTKNVIDVMNKYDLIAVVAKLWPEFKFVVIDKSEFENRIEYINTARFIFLCREIPAELSNNYNEFLSQHSENLVLQIGERTESSIKESTIGTRATDSEIIKLWKKVIADFRKDMQKGVWIVDPRSGVRKFYNNHYFTIGAQNAYVNGMKMKAFAGSSEYQLTQQNL